MRDTELGLEGRRKRLNSKQQNRHSLDYRNQKCNRHKEVYVMMFRLVVILVSGIMLSSAAVLQVEAGEKVPRAIIDTKFGSIELTFFPKKAPNHVENFLKLAKSGFYDGTIFHRIIPGFMIQGGDPNTKDDDTSTYGLGGPGYNLKAEFNNRPHGRGILSMARSQDPDSAGSQFYIVVAESSFLNGKYTVFGKVVKGMDVVDTIVSLDRDARDLPTDRIEMTVRIAE
jgi:peptidyl-prolyl cis-trans isomerase B (cyclophilin B)